MTRNHIITLIAAGTLGMSGLAYGQAQEDIRRGDGEAGIAVQRSDNAKANADRRAAQMADEAELPRVEEPARVQIEPEMDVQRRPVTREVLIDAPAADDDASRQDTAAQRELQGTVVDLRAYLQNGERAGSSATSSQGPKALLTQEGQAYLILDERSQQQDQVLAFPREGEASAEPNQNARSVTIDLAPARDEALEDAPAGDVAQAAQDMREELRDADLTGQPEPMKQDPMDGRQRQTMQGSPDLRIGQQATLSGRVLNRGGLRAILVQSGGPERQGQDEQMQGAGEARGDAVDALKERGNLPEIRIERETPPAMERQ